MKHKSIWIALVALLVVVAVGIGTTMAWLTDDDEAVNKLSIGYVDIEIKEEFNPDGPLTPGDSIEKIPTIENIGPVPCLIRAKVVISSSIVEPYLDLDTPTASTAGGWSAKQADGYYYFLGIVPAKPTQEVAFATTALFTHVGLLDTYRETDRSVDLNVNVYAEAIQVENIIATAGFPQPSATAVVSIPVSFLSDVVGAFAGFNPTP